MYTLLDRTRGARVPFSFQPARHAQLYGFRAELSRALASATYLEVTPSIVP